VNLEGFRLKAKRTQRNTECNSTLLTAIFSFEFAVTENTARLLLSPCVGESMKEIKPSESTSDESDNSANDNETRGIDKAEQSNCDEVNDSGLLCS
jgi:hypothetical protein